MPGGKGGAYVGVCKVLEEQHVKVDCIAGTSMGAPIGAGDAAGLPAADLERFVRGIDWAEIVGGTGLANTGRFRVCSRPCAGAAVCSLTAARRATSRSTSRKTCADVVIVVNLVEPETPPERLVQATQMVARTGTTPSAGRPSRTSTRSRTVSRATPPTRRSCGGSRSPT